MLYKLIVVLLINTSRNEFANKSGLQRINPYS